MFPLEIGRNLLLTYFRINLNTYPHEVNLRNLGKIIIIMNIFKWKLDQIVHKKEGFEFKEAYTLE